MISNNMKNDNKPMLINRQRMLEMLKAGLAVNSYRFTRQAALSWMTVFPGDLEINLLYAAALAGEKRFTHAAPVLEKILRADPEFDDAASLGEDVFVQCAPELLPLVSGIKKSLGSKAKFMAKVPEWGFQIARLRSALTENKVDDAQKILQEIIQYTESNVLVCFYHLLVTDKMGEKTALLNLARLYHTRWPDNLQISLLLANQLMEQGETDEAIKLLHLCAANDPAAQVPNRIWGPGFAYMPLYPGDMQIEFDMPIPAEVAGKLGLNHLAAGVPNSRTESSSTHVRSEVSSFDGYKVIPTTEEPYPQHPKVQPETKKQKSQFIVEVEESLKKVALDLSKPVLTQTDERFPVYILLSMRAGLKKQFGSSGANLVLDEMKTLSSSIQKRIGWSTLVFLPDSLAICGKYNITPVDRLDPWQIKLALVDLDKALARTGERIGAVLIVGGDEVIPFHRLPNPTEDADLNVPSDSPYGALDTNYFVTDWPVGRLPGEKGSDVGLLLEHLRNTNGYHTETASTGSFIDALLKLVFFWSRSLSDNHVNIGYSASVWRRSSLAAFRPVGEGRNLYITPNGRTKSFDVKLLSNAQIGYFNVHGIEDGSEWYGQKDPVENESGPDYPVALKPNDLERITNAPRIVFCEACYGGHIFSKTEMQSNALSMIGKGVLAMIGSTTISYGSVNTPLIGADLLGYLVLKHLKEGLPIGTALLKAKVEFVREMNRRQGYLDGEDQKTLISFVLYGDPMVSYDETISKTKVTPRELSHPVVKTISDVATFDQKSELITPKMIAQAKSMVRDYLPGIENAEVRVRNQQFLRQNGKKTAMQSGRVVVSFSKQVKLSERTHKQYARVTLDKNGKLVKLAVSR